MKFTIFGGNGFIGSNLSLYLKSLGHEVFVPTNLDEIDKSENLGHVIYAIGLTGNFRDLPFATVDAHVTKLLKLIDKSKYDSWLYLSSTRIYFSSSNTDETASINVFPNSDSIYDISKLLGESICLSIGNNKVRVVRLSNVIGKGQSKSTFIGSLINEIKSGNNILIKEDQASSKDYIAISDVVRLLYLIATIGRKRIYNLASGTLTTHESLANIIKKNLNYNVCFLNNSNLRKFPKINIDRIVNEFSFEPKCVLTEFIKLIKI